MIDLCVTELIKNPDPYQTNFGSQKWSTVVALSCFDRVNHLACLAFDHMEATGHYVPEIERFGQTGIKMSWIGDEEDRIVTLLLEPSRFSHRWGARGGALPTYTNEIQSLPAMLDLFARYLNREIEVNNDTVVGHEVSHGSGPRQPDGAGPVGPVQRHRPNRDCQCG